MKLKISFSILIWLTFAGGSLAQDYRIELSARCSMIFTKVATENSEVSCEYFPTPTVEAYYFVRQRIGVGIFYTNTFSRKAGDYDQDTRLNLNDASAQYQEYGVAAQYSTDRTRRFRFYGVVGVLKAEQFIDFEDFIIARSGKGLSLGFGAAVKITRRISLNVVDARVMVYSKDFGYGSEEGSSYGAKVSSGFIFKFWREK